MAQLWDYVQTQSVFKVSLESPLIRTVERAKIDKTLKTPSLDGSSNLLGFLNTFNGQKAFYGHSEVDRCQFVSSCLQGIALRWYNNLLPRSLDFWSILRNKFQAHFSSNYKGKKITASLMTIRQHSNESLRNFLTRFREVIAEISDLFEQLTVNYLAARIDKNCHATLLEEFFEKNPRTLHVAFQIIEHLMTLEEAMGSIQSPKGSMQRYERINTYGPLSPQMK